MYRVLVPVDRNRARAFHQARYVSRLPNAVENVEAVVLFVTSPDRPVDADAGAFSENDAAREAVEHLENEGVSVTRSREAGEVSEQIVAVADELDVDEIVVGGRKRSGLLEVLLGTTVHDVMLSAKQPVTITGETVVLGEELQRVLVPVDQDEEDTRHQAEFVTRLPTIGQTVEAIVLYVFPHWEHDSSPPRKLEDIPAADQAIEQLEAAGITVERVVAGGEVAETILETADEHNVDSIVMGGRRRSGVSKVLLGSITEDVMRSAEYPVTLTG